MADDKIVAGPAQQKMAEKETFKNVADAVGLSSTLGGALNWLMSAADSEGREDEAFEKELAGAQEKIDEAREKFRDNPKAGKMMLKKLSKDHRPLAAAFLGETEYDISQLEEKKKYIQTLNGLHDAIRQQTLKQYQTQNGQFSKQQAMGEAESRVERTGVSRTALEQLQQRGPLEMETPQMPDKDAEIIARSITSAFAGAVESIAAPAAGIDAGQAVTRSSSSEILLQSSSMINSEIEQLDERKQKVEAINLELMAKHRDNVTELQNQYDRRLDAAERMYQKMKLQEFRSIVDRYDKYKSVAMRFKQAGIEANLSALSQEEQNMRWGEAQDISRKKFNVGEANKMRRYNDKKAMRLNELRLRQRAAARKNAVSAMPDLSEKVAALNAWTGVSFNETSDAVNKGLQVMSSINIPEGSRATANEYANVFIDRISSEDYSPEQRETLLNNFMKMSQRGFMLDNLNENNMKKLANKEFSTTQQGDIVIAEDEVFNSSLRQTDLSYVAAIALTRELGQQAQNTQERVDKTSTENKGNYTDSENRSNTIFKQ